MAAGYTHSDKINIIDGLIDYYIWTDSCGSPIGISVNFEYADDVHYELRYGDWVRFLKDCLHTTLEDCSKALYTYFSKSDSHMFRNILTDNKISFDRVVFFMIPRFYNQLSRRQNIMIELIPGEAFTATGHLAEKLLDKITATTEWVITPKGSHKYKLEAENYLIEKIKDDTTMPPMVKAACISRARCLLKEYVNQADIFQIATQYLIEGSNPQNLDDDWLSFFWNHAKTINRTDMKIIWGKILAEECNIKGSFSKSLIHTLTIIGYEEAQVFQAICNFCVKLPNHITPIVFESEKSEYYEKYGITSAMLSKLDDLGLIEYKSNHYYGIEYFCKNTPYFEIQYFDSLFKINIKKWDRRSIGTTLLTLMGKELMSILELNQIDDFKNILREQFDESKAEKHADCSTIDS